MSLESSIEKMIQKAVAAGEFDNLKGAGKRLDLTGYFNTPEDLRMAYAMLKSNQFIPEEVELMNEIAELKKKLGNNLQEDERNALSKKLNEKMLALNVALEKYKRPRR
jgi:hypothetical protein